MLCGTYRMLRHRSPYHFNLRIRGILQSLQDQNIHIPAGSYHILRGHFSLTVHRGLRVGINSTDLGSCFRKTIRVRSFLIHGVLMPVVFDHTYAVSVPDELIDQLNDQSGLAAVLDAADAEDKRQA